MQAGSTLEKHKIKQTALPTDLSHRQPRFLVSAVHSTTKTAC